MIDPTFKSEKELETTDILGLLIAVQSIAWA